MNNTQINRNKRWYVRAFSMLLCMAMLLGSVLMLLPLPTLAATAGQSSSTEQQVALRWQEGTPTDLQGVRARPDISGKKSAQLTAEVYIPGGYQHDVTVWVETFDISTGQSSLYTAINQQITLTRSAPVAKIVIHVSSPTRYSTSINDENFTWEFGVRLKGIDEGSIADDGRVLTSTVCTEESYAIALSRNTASEYYGQTNYLQKLWYGYVYSGMNEEQRKTGIPFATATLTDRDQSTSFKERVYPKDIVRTNENLAKLLLAYGGRTDENDNPLLQIWVNGNGYFDDDTFVSVQGFSLFIHDTYGPNPSQIEQANGYKVSQFGASTSKSQNWSDSSTAFNFFDYAAFGSPTTSIGVSTLPGRSDYSSKNKYMRISRNDHFLDVTVRNLSAYKKHFGTNNLQTLLAWDTAPYVTSYDIANTTYAVGDYLYIRVKFSTHVQLENRDSSKPLILQASIGDNAPIDFTYYTGSYTDTLVFRAQITKDIANSLSSKTAMYVQPVGFKNLATGIDDGLNRVCDLFWNSQYNQNNIWDHAAENVILKQSSIRLYCKIDVRTPSITITGTLPNTVKTTHTVSFDIEKMDSNGEVYYALSQSTNSKGLSFIKFNGYSGPGSYSITESQVTGDYYLYIRAVNGVGTQRTVRTDTPLRFDNTAPQITSLTSENYAQYKSSHAFSLTVNENTGGSGVKSVYLYFESEDGLYSLEKHPVYDKNATGNAMTTVGDTYSITLTAGLASTDLINVAADYYGRFRIGFLAEDALGNTQGEPTWFYDTVPFDTRNTFAVNITTAPDKTVSGQHIFYNDTPVTFSTTELQTGDRLTVDSVKRDGVTVFEKGAFTASDHGIATDLAALSLAATTGTPTTFDMAFSDAAVGRYEVALSKNGEQSSNILLFYVTGKGENLPANYKAIWAQDRLLVNEVWQFATNKFYSYGNEPCYYGGTGISATPIFSDYAHAYLYAQVMEYTDLELLYFDESAASVLESFNNGTNNVYRKATEDAEIAAQAGQTWIRYKASTWQIGDNSTQSWVYYFYKEGQHTTLDVTALSASVQSAIQKVSEQIANKDNPAAKLILSSCYGRVNANGEPLYAKEATFAKPLLLESGVSCTFSPAVAYEGDAAIYDSFITYNGISMPLIANYTFTVDASSFLYYRLRDDAQSTYTKAAGGMTLRSLLGGKSGVYQFAEFGAGAGYREYVAYCDFDEPILTYTIGDGTTVSHLDANLNNTTLRSNRLTIFNIVNSLCPNGNYRNELDKYAYVYIKRGKNSTTEDVVAYYTLKELNSNTEGIILPSGSYELGVCDRLGNKTVLLIRTNSEPPSITYAVRENTSVKFTISRSAAELLPGGFRVYFNGKDETPAFQNELTFVKSGTYRIEIQDIYGMSAEREYTFMRAYPTVEFSYKGSDGAYKKLKEGTEAIAAAFLQKTNGNLYYISAAADLRIRFDDSLYNYEFIEEPASYTLRNGQLDIPLTEQSFVMKIFYRNDEGTAVIITSIKDETPPSIAAETNLISYTYHNEIGLRGVLFDPATRLANKHTLQNGETVTSDSITLTATDDTMLSTIYYTKDNDALQTLDASLGSWQIVGAGSYTVTAVDVLGNKSTFSFTLGKPLDFNWYIGADLLTPENPIAFLEKSGEDIHYTKTDYTGKSVKLVLGNNLSVAFYYWNEVTSGLCTFTVADGKIAYAGYDETLGVMVGADPAALAESGTLSCSFLDVSYTYDGTYLTLLFKEPTVSLERLYIRVNSATGFDPYILQLERSNTAPTLPLVTEDGTAVGANASNFTGTNKVLTLDPPLLDADLLQVVAHHSLVHTTDFTNAEQIMLYQGSAVASLTENGFYKIVATNKYGNSTTYLVRISFGFNVDIETTYHSFESKGYTYTQSGTHAFRTNKSLKVILYNEEVLLTAFKDNVPYTPTTQIKNGSMHYTFTEQGTYTVIIRDACENLVTLTVTVAAPTTLAYNSFLVGFNQSALWRDAYYTNTALSLSPTAIEESHIAYVAYRRVGTTAYTRLFDAISHNRLAFDATRMMGETDGDFEVLFADLYGNTCQKTVHISRAESLSLSRVTQSSVAKEPMSLSSALALGAWSNHILTLQSNAPAYALAIDGKAATLDGDNGTYTFTFPSTLGEGEQRYNVSFVDAYGNTYTFTVVLYRKVPTATLNCTDPLISMNGKQYVRADFSYTWEAEHLTATYRFENGDDQVYQKETPFTKDGVYTIFFTDMAGNTDSRTIIRDSVVGIKMTSNKNTVYDNALTNSPLYIRAQDDTVTFVSVLLNGEEIDAPADGIFSAYGHYEVLVQDAIGNSRTVCFDILNKHTKTASLTAPAGYALSQVWFYVDGFKISHVGNVTTNDTGNQVYAMDRDGIYEINLLHLDSSTVTTLSFVVDNEAPAAVLKDTEPGTTTRGNVTLDGLTKGDTVHIYRDGTLYATYVIDGSGKPPVISEAGEYRVVVTDLAGNTVSYDFVRAFTTNTASNIFIILLLLLTAFGGLVLIRLKGKLRTK